MLYIVSISFQIAGAITLLLSSLKKKIEEKICRIIFWKRNWEHSQWEWNDTLNKDKVKDIAKSIILNRCAFVDLILGYATAICAEQTANTDTIIGIVAFTFMLMCIECGVSEEMSKAQAEKNMKVHAINSWGLCAFMQC